MTSTFVIVFIYLFIFTFASCIGELSLCEIHAVNTQSKALFKWQTVRILDK